jgi:hypothetical protein
VSRDPARFAWTRPQRRTLLLLLAALLAFLTLRYALNPVYVGDPQPERPARFDELADRIDPNTADWTMLAALPGIGEKRAREIVAYRDDARPLAPGGVVFARKQDLLRIKGIGPAMLEAIEPYLTFPPEPASTRSAKTLSATTRSATGPTD